MQTEDAGEPSSARCAPGWTTTSSGRGPRPPRRGDDGDDAEERRGPLPGRRHRRPPERRQVDAGQPHPRPPRGRRRGHPGVTRDRVTYEAEWIGRRVHRSSTPAAGSPTPSGIDRAVAAQAEVAIDLADVVLFVVDAMVGATDDRRARRQAAAQRGKPVFLVANKVDDQRTEPDAAALWSLGLGEPYPVSALHGRGSGDLLDDVLKVLPEVSAMGGATRSAARAASRSSAARTSASPRCSTSWPARSASSSTTSPAPPATRSTSSSSSAARRGVRRHRRHPSPRAPASGADFYASLRTQAALEKAEVAVVLIDASRADHRAGRADHRAGPRGRPRARPRVQQVGPHSTRSAATTSSARSSRTSRRSRGRRASTSRPRTGRHLDKLVPALETALDSWDTRIPTGKFNAFLAELVAAHPHPVRGGKQPRILFATQASHPPAAVRAVRDRLPRGRLPPVHRAPPARGVRLRGHADRDLGAGAREAHPALTSSGCRDAGAIRSRPARLGKVASAPARGRTGCGAAW